MDRRAFHRHAALALLGLGAAGARAAETTVRLGIGEWPPFFGAELRQQGVFAHLVAEAFRREGLPVAYTSMPWKRALSQVESGVLHGSPGWTHNEERARLFLYSDPVLISREVLFFARKKPLRFRGEEDLRGLVLGATSSYHYGPLIDQLEQTGQLRLDRAPSDELSLRKLLLGRVDAVLLNREVGLELLRRRFTPAEREALDYSERPVAEKPSHLVMSRALPEVPALLQAFNRGLAQLQREGVVRRWLDEANRGGYG